MLRAQPVAVLTLLFLAALAAPTVAGAGDGAGAGAGAEAGGWSDAEIEAALTAACRREPRVLRYRGLADYDIPGPLWLAEPGEERPRGVILTPRLRLYLLATHKWNCGKLDLEAARELAGPEIWVVLWRTEDPPGPPGSDRTSYDQKVLTPTEVRYRAGGSWHDPLWTRTRDSKIAGWYWQDWNERHGLVAAFPSLDRGGSLWVDYRVEEHGRSALTDSAVFSLTTFQEKWWAAAFGGEEE